ncbi:hypothetical protein CAG70_17685 [Photobacterium halotolerans]|uniref:BRCT domain-containing protein n=1 Tax=Photobacterium halotolerans TaxID=265726 RepID=UPI001372AD0D|nr:BRCT domain-containing protein [Photobacterium halotolerans]NAX48819.1 hypothetical protein [Photobacterium halotolerans]
MSELICVYRNNEGFVSVLSLRNTSHNEPYIQGWCERFKAPRTLRIERIINTFDTLQDANDYLNNFDPDEIVSPSQRKALSASTFDVHFTGFKKADKTQLTEIAKANGMTVRGEVTKNLNVLCYGYNAGQKKLEKALDQGCIILNEPQFTALIETGEIPEE